MKTLQYIELKNNDQIIKDSVTGLELNTQNIIIICLGQSVYKNVHEQWEAYDINTKLKSLSNETASGLGIQLSDSEFSLVKKKVEEFDPFRVGFTFIPFLDLFKD